MVAVSMLVIASLARAQSSGSTGGVDTSALNTDLLNAMSTVVGAMGTAAQKGDIVDALVLDGVLLQLLGAMEQSWQGTQQGNGHRHPHHGNQSGGAGGAMMGFGMSSGDGGMFAGMFMSPYDSSAQGSSGGAFGAGVGQMCMCFGTSTQPSGTSGSSTATGQGGSSGTTNPLEVAALTGQTPGTSSATQGTSTATSPSSRNDRQAAASSGPGSYVGRGRTSTAVGSSSGTAPVAPLSTHHHLAAQMTNSSSTLTTHPAHGHAASQSASDAPAFRPGHGIASHTRVTRSSGFARHSVVHAPATSAPVVAHPMVHHAAQTLHHQAAAHTAAAHHQAAAVQQAHHAAAAHHAASLQAMHHAVVQHHAVTQAHAHAMAQTQLHHAAAATVHHTVVPSHHR
jgi:hypothetical protein